MAENLVKRFFRSLFKPFGYVVVKEKDMTDFYLHEYSSYDEYKTAQVFHNKRKIDRVFADKKTLDRVAELVLREFKDIETISGICHGSRNGFEQNYLREASKKFDVIGTDISDTANNYENSFQWDFHDVNDAWLGSKDFIYTNSLDQAWKPQLALETWLAQLKENGILIIEHTKSHGPAYASKMDPFGVRPTSMPYVLTMWFGSQISLEHSVQEKLNSNLDAWLFVIRKNQSNVALKGQ